MDFVEKETQFYLNMTLQESVDLWRIVSESYGRGNKSAEKFVDSLYEFARQSNSYGEVDVI